MVREFRIIGHTTMDPSPSSMARRFLGWVSTCLGDPVAILNSTARADEWIPWEDIGEGLLSTIYANDGMAVRCAGGVGFVVTWRKHRSRHHWERFARRNGFAQNTIYISVPETSLAESLIRERQVIDLVQLVAESVRLNYLTGIDGRVHMYDHRFDTRLGIGIGLKDIYPMNYFGRPYLNMIGKDKILDLPASHISMDSWGALVRPLGRFVDYNEEEMVQKRIEIRQYLGEEYFAAPSPPAGGVQVSWIGAIFKAFWEEHRRFNDLRGAAKRRPEFDWSGLFEGR